MGLFRKIIRISAMQSPSVRLAHAQIAAGQQPTGEQVIPGVLSWADFVERSNTLNDHEKTVKLYAQFYKGPGLFLFPQGWLQRAERIANELQPYTVRYGIRPPQSGNESLRCGDIYMGVDVGEGGDNTAFCVGDIRGILELQSLRTPDTSVITGQCLGLMRKWNIYAYNVGFDRGGGGKQHADRLRDQGYAVRTIGFGETPSNLIQNPSSEEEKELKEQKAIYRSRRVQLYAEASKLLDPNPIPTGSGGFQDPPGYGIPSNTPELAELHRQLSKFPIQYNEDGIQILPPKQKRDSKDKRLTLKDMIGRSPDEADAFVLLIHMILTPPVKSTFEVVSTVPKNGKVDPKFYPIPRR